MPTEQWFNILDCPMPRRSTNLRDRTRELLHNRNRTLTYKAIESDTGLNRKWLAKFSRGLAKNPGVVHVETLYVYLSKHELKV